MDLRLLEKAYMKFNEETWQRKGQLEIIEKNLEQKIKQNEEIGKQIYLYRQVNEVFKSAAEFARDQSKTTMEKLVSNALTIVFPGDLEFNIEMLEKGNKTEADLYVSSTYGGQHQVKTEPQESRGGGIVDIISLALRVALLETSTPKLKGPLVLDEPAKHVSQDYAQNVAEFLNLVVESFNRQVIMVTHNNYLSDTGDKTFTVAIDKGVTHVVSGEFTQF